MHHPVSRSASPASPAMPAVKNNLYYSTSPVEFKVSFVWNYQISDMNTWMQVENELFKIPREGLLQSSKFVELYGISSMTASDLTLEPDQIEVHDVEVAEFTSFLKILLRP